ncbi:MAG: hypothetical protein V1653_02300 [bacterium]
MLPARYIVKRLKSLANPVAVKGVAGFGLNPAWIASAIRKN